MARTPEPAFVVNETVGNIELRTYQPMVVAEVKMPGTRDAAIQAGFRVLAGYIFGGNVSKSSIAMTAPVSQQKSEKIAMTVPVSQQNDGGDWRVRFVMPDTYTLETLPVPDDKSIGLFKMPAKRFAVIRFSGWSTDSNISQHRDDLFKFLKSRDLATSGEPVMAFYDPPWTLPFWRRNEIMLELQ